MKAIAFAGIFTMLVDGSIVGVTQEQIRPAQLRTPPVAATAHISQIKSVATQGEPHHLRLDGDTLSFCDQRGAQAIDLKTSRSFARADICRAPDEPNSACRQSGIDVEIRAPLSAPDDILDINGISIQLKGRVHDCAVEGGLMAIVTGSSVDFVDVVSAKLTTIDRAGGERVVVDRSRIIWSAGSRIRWIEIASTTRTGR